MIGKNNRKRYLNNIKMMSRRNFATTNIITESFKAPSIKEAHKKCKYGITSDRIKSRTKRNIKNYLIWLFSMCVTLQGGNHQVSEDIEFNEEDNPSMEGMDILEILEECDYDFERITRVMSEYVYVDLEKTVKSDLTKLGHDLYSNDDNGLYDHFCQNILVRHGLKFAYALSRDDDFIFRKYEKMVIVPYLNMYIPYLSRYPGFVEIRIEGDDDDEIFLENDNLETRRTQIMNISLSVSEERKSNYTEINKIITKILCRSISMPKNKLYNSDYNETEYFFGDDNESFFYYLVKKHNSIGWGVFYLTICFEQLMYERRLDPCDNYVDDNTDENLPYVLESLGYDIDNIPNNLDDLVSDRIYSYFENFMKFFGLLGIRVMDSDSYFRNQFYENDFDYEEDFDYENDFDFDFEDEFA